MSVRAASWAFLAVLFAAAGLAAGRPAIAESAVSSAPRTIPAGTDSYPVATDVRLGGDASQTRFILDLSRKIDVHAFTLADPYRVVLDISEVTFALPSKSGESGRGL